MMSSLVILFVVSCAGYVAAAKEIATLPPDKAILVLQVSMPCIAETGVSPDQIIQYRSGKTTGNDINLQKFIHCVSTRSGYSDKNGHVKVEKALQVFPDKIKENIKKVLEQCNKEDGANPTETSYKVAKCFHQNSPVQLVI